MSSTVEDQIVAMRFDNKQFESGVAQSLGTLDKLKSAMQFKGAANGLADVNSAVGKFNMNPMSSAIEGVSKMWLGLTTVAVTAIANITNKVIDAGIRMGKSLTIDPLTAGFAEYSTNLNSIQTIIANTGAKLPAVNDTLRQLNEYSDKTIYNFSQMAQNIGRFTAAGVEMGAATEAIKGMANTAALTGATSEQLNSAMYQMSQALSSGVIRLMDWNSLVNANMGTENVQKALIATTRSFGDNGAAMDAAIEKNGNFRDSLSEGWLSAETFTKTMKVMAGQLNKTTGDYEAFTVEQLKGMGYSAEAAKELNRLSQASIDAATKVKTIGQAYDVVKESIGSGWAQVFQNIFGNFNQSKKLWTGVTEFITGGISNVFDSINGYLEEWQELGGRTDMLAGLKQAFKDFYRVYTPIKNAFKEVFPPQAGNALASFSSAFRSFFEMLRPSVKTMRGIREVFVVIFTVIKFGFGLIGNLFDAFQLLFGLFSGSSTGDLLDFVDVVFEAVQSFVDWVREGEKLEQMLKGISKLASAFVNALKPLVPVLQAIGNNIANVVSEGADIAKNLIDGIVNGLNAASLQQAMVDLANNIVTWIKDALGIHSPAETMIPIGVNIIMGIAEGLYEGMKALPGIFRSIFETIASGLGLLVEGLGRAFADAMQNMDLESFLEIMNTLLTGGFLLAARNVAKSFSGISRSASGVLDQISGSLKTMQNEVRAEIIKSIAISVALLAGSAYLLSKLDAKQLGYSLGAIAGLMAALTASMRILLQGNAGMSFKDVTKKSAAMAGLGAAMVAFATAVVILSGAVAILGKMDQNQLVQGLEAVGAVVLGVVAATAILSKTGGGGTLFATAAALLVLSVALVAFAGTLKLYANLDWNMIVEGGAKAGAVIVAIGLAMRAFGKFAITGSIGMIIAATALLILASALKKISKIPSEALGDTLVALVVVLGAVALAGAALKGGAIGLLAGAAAILVIAGALAILAKIPADQLTKAFVFIGLAFTALVIAAGALAPLTPIMLAFGAAALLVGQGIALAGLGVLAFATALGIIAIVAPAAFQAMSDGVILMTEALGPAIPIFTLAGAALIVFGAGAIVGAAGLVILSGAVIIFSGAIIILSAAIVIGAGALALLAGAIALMRGQAGGAIGDIIGAFRKLGDIRGILSGIKDWVVDLVAGWIADFGRKVENLRAAIGAGIQMVKDKLTEWKDDVLQWGADVGTNIIQGVVNGLDTAKQWVLNKISEITDLIPGWMKSKLGIDSPSKVMRDDVGRWIAIGLADGISQHAGAAEKSSKELADKSLDAMRVAFNNSRKMGDSLRDVRPKITPILDLTELEKDATKISGKLGGRQTINVGASGRKAQDISANEGRRAASGSVSVNETYNFNQTVNSPKPVNKVQIYRATKSQFALFKEVKG